MNVLLIGYRGSGKSTVGPLLAERLGLVCVDADEQLQQRAGRTIKEIFERDGEAAFRDMESAVLQDLLACDGQVVALGGGVVLRPENRTLLRQRGFVVWLTASIDTLLARIEGDASTASARPNLTSEGGRGEIARLLAQREPLYKQCADLVLDTTGMTPEQIVDAVVTKLPESDRQRENPT